MRTAAIFTLTAAMLAGGAVAQAAPSREPDQRSPRDSIHMYEIEPLPAVSILLSSDRGKRTEALDFVFNGEELDLPSTNAFAGFEATPAPVESDSPEASEPTQAPSESDLPEAPEE